MPQTELVDPVIRRLIQSGVCSERELGLDAVYPYFLWRGSFSPSWIEELASASTSSACPNEAVHAVRLLGRLKPLPVPQQRVAVSSFQGSVQAVQLWNALMETLREGNATPAERAAFIDEILAQSGPSAPPELAALRDEILRQSNDR